MPTIAFEGASVAFDGVTLLEPLTLTLTEQRIGIIGANGSGKSTLARLINGLIEPTTGTVTFSGLDTRKEGKAVRSRVGFVFSDAESQIVMPRVADDIAFSLRGRKLSKEEKKEAVDRALRRFQLLDRADHSPHTLSGGEKQLLALAAVLVLEPETIVADEPTTLLDLRNRRRIAREFSQLEQQLVVVTHDLDLVRDFDRVLVINEGQVAYDAPPAEAIEAYLDLMDAAE